MINRNLMLRNEAKEETIIGSILNDTSSLNDFSFREGDFTNKLWRCSLEAADYYHEKGIMAIDAKMIIDFHENIKGNKPNIFGMCDYEKLISDVKANACDKCEFEKNYNILKKWRLLRDLDWHGIDVSNYVPNEFDPDEVKKEKLEKFYNYSLNEMIDGLKDTIKEIEERTICSTDTLDFEDVNTLSEDGEIEYLVDDFMLKNTFNSIIAPAKAGKSQFAYQLAFCVQNGLNFLGNKTNPVDVIYVDYELRESVIKKRFNNLKELYGLSDAKGYSVLRLSDKLMYTNLDDTVIKIKKQKELNPNIGLVIFDCFYRFAEGDPNSEPDTKKTLSKIKELESLMTVCYVHHTNKTGFNNVKNSIYAAGGSGVHGKIIDETYLIERKSGDDVVIVSDGRDWTEKRINAICNDKTFGFFKENPKFFTGKDSLYGGEVITKEEKKQSLKINEPELYEAIGEDGETLYKLKQKFSDITPKKLKEKGFRYDSTNKKAYLI